MKMHNQPFTAPTIIYWNVRSTKDFLQQVMIIIILISGYSPALMKFILSGEMTSTETVEKDGKMKSITPAEALHKYYTIQALILLEINYELNWNISLIKN